MKAYGIVITGDFVEGIIAAASIVEENAHRTWATATVGAVE